jgi:hypothetical protein
VTLKQMPGLVNKRFWAKLAHWDDAAVGVRWHDGTTPLWLHRGGYGGLACSQVQPKRRPVDLSAVHGIQQVLAIATVQRVPEPRNACRRLFAVNFSSENLLVVVQGSF